jgi:site-specific DNA-methyltransferase (adenine-specific)
MSLLLHGDCLEQMKGIDTGSVDLIFCDLPYGQTSCKWDIIIPWKPFWDEIMRVKKLNTPIFFTTTTKFGVELINNAPKKCFFRYDLVWVKSAPAGFLCAKKMPMRKHEMVYVFYEKLPFYDLSSHKHKFIKQYQEEPMDKSLYGTMPKTGKDN